MTTFDYDSHLDTLQYNHYDGGSDNPPTNTKDALSSIEDIRSCLEALEGDYLTGSNLSGNDHKEVVELIEEAEYLLKALRGEMAKL